MAKAISITYMLCEDSRKILCNDGKLRNLVNHNNKKESIKFSKQPWRFEKIALKMGLKRWKTVFARNGDRVFSNGDIHRLGGAYEHHGIPTKKTNIGKLIEV